METVTKRNISPEVRAARSARMKELHAKGVMGRKPKVESNGDVLKQSLPKLHPDQERTAAIPLASVLPKIIIEIDWQRIPMPEAQALYQILKKEYERAGTLLNDRSMPNGNSYKCWVCELTHERPARGIDFAHKNEESGLMEPVECCGERCWAIYQQRLIDARRKRNIAEREAHGS